MEPRFCGKHTTTYKLSLFQKSRLKQFTEWFCRQVSQVCLLIMMLGPADYSWWLCVRDFININLANESLSSMNALFNSPIQVVCSPPQEDTSRQVTFESPPPPVSTSTAQSTAEGLCHREESSSDSEKEKPIWRPKLKRKRKKNNRQGWWLPPWSSSWLINNIYEKNSL